MDKAFVIVPHQDDEINLVGNILDVIKSAYEIVVIYTSLDAQPKNASIRRKEAIQACGLYGIDQENIIFLGYPDTPNATGDHFYRTEKRSVIQDLKDLILQQKPSVIFATDFDFHSDHRMCSLAFETAMGEILRETDNYFPLVFKGFCYETAYYGPEDYCASCLGKSKSSFSIASNPVWEWEKRISITGREKSGLLIRRKAYKALVKHRSQYAVLHARSIVNADNVFWLKRTDNLIYKAKVTVSSGDAHKLCDFKVLDTNDIITIDPRKIDYSEGVWRPDTSAEISIVWENAVEFDRIIFHGDPNLSTVTKVNIQVYVNDIEIGALSELRECGRETVLMCPRTCADRLVISINNETGLDGLSEIEILNGEQCVPDIFTRNFSDCESQNCFLDNLDFYTFQLAVLCTKVMRKIRRCFNK